MSVRTVFLARIFGLYCIIMAVAMLSQPEAFVTTVNALVANAPLVLIASVLAVRRPRFGAASQLLVWRGTSRHYNAVRLAYLDQGCVVVGSSADQTGGLVGGVSPTYILISGSLTLRSGFISPLPVSALPRVGRSSPAARTSRAAPPSSCRSRPTPHVRFWYWQFAFFLALQRALALLYQI